MAALAFKEWFVCFRPSRRAQIRLLCLPYAGGGVAVYHAWSRLLPPTIEVYALVMPGRDSRVQQQPYQRLSPLVQGLVEAAAPTLREQPFAVFGHSMGALLGFESLRLLQRDYACTPQHFFASAQAAPQCIRRREPFHCLPDAAFIAAVKEHYQGIPQAVLDEPELLALFLPMLRADFALVETYTYVAGPPLQCPVTGFWGTEDPMALGPQVEAWGQQTCAPCVVHALPGGHFFLRQQQHRVLDIITRTLDDTAQTR